MASIFIYKDKIYMNVRINGKQVKKSTGLDNTKANKLYVQKELLPQFLENEFESKLNVKLSYYINRFLSEKQFLLKERTLQRYKSIVEQWIEPKFANLKVQEIKTSMLKEYLNHQYNLGKSAKAVELYRTVFSGILQEAVYDEVIASNPFINIKRRQKKKPTILPLSTEEVKLLLDNCDGWLRNYIGIATHLGLRSGEITGLKWIDINTNTIKIQRTRDFNKDGEPKTASSKRELPIFSSVKPFIDSQRELTGSGEYVFVKYDGTPWANTQSIAKYHWYPLLNRLGLKPRRLYEMRHTFATNMLASGYYKVTDISMMMGHTTTEYLFNVYSKYIESEKKSIPLDKIIY